MQEIPNDSQTIDDNSDIELSACVSKLSRLNLAMDNAIPALSAYLENSDENSVASGYNNENFMRLIHDYRETHEWLRTMMVDQSMIVQCKQEFIHFIDKMRDRLQYYNEEICFDYKNPHYADVSPANRERLMYIEQSLRESIRDLEDWKKSLIVTTAKRALKAPKGDVTTAKRALKAPKGDVTTAKRALKAPFEAVTTSGEKQKQMPTPTTQKSKITKKSRIDAAIDKMQNRSDAISASVSKLRKTIHSIYDFHHLSYEFLCDD